MHIVLLLILVTIYIVILFYYTKFVQDRDLILDSLYAVQFFVIGIQDIFVSFMLWIALDQEEKPLFIEDHQTGQFYQVLKVLNDNLVEEDQYYPTNVQLVDEYNEEDEQNIPLADLNESLTNHSRLLQVFLTAYELRSSTRYSETVNDYINSTNSHHEDI